MSLARSTVLPNVLAFTALLLTAGCGPSPSALSTSQPHAAVSGWPRTIEDASRTSLTLAAAPKRIVSLAPSNTEILFALGAGDRVVADTESCDYPAEARRKPHIGGMSAGDLEKIQVAFPDLVVAVGSVNSRLIGALRAARVPTLVVDPHTTADVLASIRLIGRAIGSDARGESVAADLGANLDRVRKLTAGAKMRPKTLIAYSAGPIYTSPPESFIHDLIGTAGGEDIVQQPLPQNIISPAVVIERAPEVIICSASLRERLKALPGWTVIPAIRNERFFTSAAGAELTRPGPRLGPAVEQLARYLHPELFATSAASAPH